MHWTAKNIIYGRAFLTTVLGAFKALTAEALIDAAKVRLSANPDFAPNSDSTIAQLAVQEANFSGYTAGGVALVVGNPVQLTTSALGTQTPVTFATATADPFVPNEVYGWWVDDTTRMICAERFPLDTVALFQVLGHYLQLDVITPLPLVMATGQ